MKSETKLTPYVTIQWQLCKWCTPPGDVWTFWSFFLPETEWFAPVRDRGTFSLYLWDRRHTYVAARQDHLRPKQPSVCPLYVLPINTCRIQRQLCKFSCYCQILYYNSEIIVKNKRNLKLLHSNTNNCKQVIVYHRKLSNIYMIKYLHRKFPASYQIIKSSLA